MGLSFLISSFLNGTVFIKNTARIRPYLDKIIIGKLSSATTLLSQIQVSLPAFQLPNLGVPVQIADKPIIESSLSRISQGIYAEKNSSTSYTLIKENEVEWKEYSLNIRGTKVVIRVPKDENVPSSDIIQFIAQ